MPHHQARVFVQTRGRGFTDATSEIRRVVTESEIVTGLCSLFLRHTSASLVIQENADPAVLRDLGRWMDRLAPEDVGYEHDSEGPDDMPSHLRAAVTRSSETIAVASGELALGTWQAIYVWEHRRSSHRRELVVHVTGEVTR
jgi:secondary thiamine-phosphate synthase enzyme